MTWKLIVMLAFFAACLAPPASACLIVNKKTKTETKAGTRLNPNKQLGCIDKPQPHNPAQQKSVEKRAA